MNKVILTNARIVKDLEPKTLNSGTTILGFTVAVARDFKKDETDFINCVAFGKTAETIANYFHKGSVISLEGSLQVSNYENKEGHKVYKTDVIVNRMEFPLGNKKANDIGIAPVNKSNSPNDFKDLTPVDDEDIPF